MTRLSEKYSIYDDSYSYSTVGIHDDTALDWWMSNEEIKLFSSRHTRM